MPTTNKTGEALALDLQKQGIKPGDSTASGQAATPESHSPTDTADTSKEAKGTGDTALKPAKNSDAQTMPAAFVRSGSLPHANLPSNTGPVPAGLVLGTQDEVDTAVDHHRASVRQQLLGQSYQAIPEERLMNASAAELRAFATDRGYDIGEGGRRVLRARFLKAQDEDEALSTAKPSTADKADQKAIDAATPSVSTVGGIAVATPQTPA